MKKGFVFYLIVNLAFLVSCNSEKQGKSTSEIINSEIYLFIDVTDSIIISSLKNPILEIMDRMGLDTIDGGYSGGIVKLYCINDISGTSSEKEELGKGKKGLMGENKLDRRDKVIGFYHRLSNKYNDLLENNQGGKPQSKIYHNICHELNDLVTSKCDPKIVIIYSDMLEHSNLFSFYGVGYRQRINRLIANLDQTVESLSLDCQLPDLTGIEIHIVVTKTPENDDQIILAEKFWTKLFRHKNAIVDFGSDLDL